MGPNTPRYGYVGEQKKKLPIKMVALLLGIVIVLFIAIFVISSALNKDSIATQSAHLTIRLTNLTTLTSGATKQLHSGDLQKINAETAIITDGVQADLAGTLSKKVDKSIIADEADTTDTTKLSNASLAGTYDAEYKQVLQEKLESITALLTEMYGKTKSRSLQSTLNIDYKNYDALLANLNKISV